MKKIFLALVVLMMVTFAACGNKLSSSEVEEPSLTQIRQICKLATLECYYHNVAKSTKTAGSGLTHWFEEDRDFWTEYSGVVKLGVDMSKGNMEVNGSEIIISMPDAEVLSIKPDATSVQDPIVEADSINSNPILSTEVTQAINDSESMTKEQIENNSSLLASAQDRAKNLIANYINQLGEVSGVKFTIKWKSVNEQQ